MKFDYETEQPVRTSEGRCILCGPGEVGEMVGGIVQGDPSREFSGYTRTDATEKKVIRGGGMHISEQKRQR